MCTYHTLYHNEKYGYIIKCLQCQSIQLAFGNICITFPVEEFASFFNVINKFASNLDGTEAAHAKNIYIPTPCEDVRMLLSYNELSDLVNMLDMADTELQSQQLLALFNGQGLHN